MKITYSIILILFFVSLYSCSLEKRAITFNSTIGEVEGSTYSDLKLFKRSGAFMINGRRNEICYRGLVLINDKDSVELISGTPELTRALNDDSAFQATIQNAISEFERIGATIIDGSFHLDSIHYVKYHYSPTEYVIILDSKPSDALLQLMLGKKYYVLEDGLRYYVKEKKR